MAFHEYQINELYSNASGTIQFIEMTVGGHNDESFWTGISISVTQGTTAHLYTFPTDLPGTQTANTSVLIATQGFADLGIVTPNYIVPSGFLFVDGGLVNYGGVDFLSYPSLPTDGTLSLNRSLATGVNSPTNFAGNTGSITAAADQVIQGTDGADSLIGGAGNDTIFSGAGNDTIDGGAGADTSVYGFARAAYALPGAAPGFVTGPEGTDMVTSIERYEFSDRKLAFDLNAGEAAGNTVRIIGAAFDADYILPQFVAIGLDLFDAGRGMLEVCELALGTPLWLSVAGSASNEAFVDTVYENVAGVAPPPAVRDAFVSLLVGSGGGMTQAELLMFAANHAANESNINLVGLQQTGVEFV